MKVLLCPLSTPGFLYPALAIGRELQCRGHEVTVLCQRQALPLTNHAGLRAVAADELGDDQALAVSKAGISGVEQYKLVTQAVRETGADVVLTSLLCHGALLACEQGELPSVVLGLAAYLWPYRAGGEGDPDAARRRRLLEELLRHYHAVRELVGMPGRREPRRERPLTGSALLLRGDPLLELPDATLPEQVVHVGPCGWEPPADPSDVEQVMRLTRRSGKPIVYVHLGRIFGGESLWPRLNATFANSPFQAVVERGRSGVPAPAADADIVVVRRPWMKPLVAMADVVLSNATSAPVLTALQFGRPLVVAPNGAEQPLLARACQRAGVAVQFAEAAASVQALRHARDHVRLRPELRKLSTRLRDAPGAMAAADVVLSAASNRPRLMHTFGG